MRLAAVALAVTLGLGAFPAHANDVAADVDRYIAELEKRLDELGAEARQRFEARRPIIRRRMEELRRRGEEAWKHLRSEMDRVLDELRRELDERHADPDVTAT
jgi:ElaB/YqjD/DUF883 family membrane-anchored ribosome-binding protein